MTSCVREEILTRLQCEIGKDTVRLREIVRDVVKKGQKESEISRYLDKHSVNRACIRIYIHILTYAHTHRERERERERERVLIIKTNSKAAAASCMLRHEGRVRTMDLAL